MDKRAQFEKLQREPKSMVLRVATKAADPTEKQLAKIKPFLLRDFSADDLYIREMMLANDQTDRSGENFDAGYLKRFAETIVGKSVLIGHDHGSAPFGKFFDATVTKDDQGWQWVAPWFYTPKSAGNQLERDYIDSGVWSYVSIGANVDYKGLICNVCKQPYYWWLADDESAAHCPHITGEVYDGQTCTLTWDSAKSDMSIVEAVEGSIVYLGCQYEAAIAKSAEAVSELKSIKRELVTNMPQCGDSQEVSMKTVEQLETELAAKATELSALDTEKTALEAKVKELEPLAEVGKALQEDLIAEVVRLSKCLQMGDSYEAAVKHFSVAELKATRADLEKQWATKRPAQGEGEHVGSDGEPATKAPHAMTSRGYDVI